MAESSTSTACTVCGRRDSQDVFPPQPVPRRALRRCAACETVFLEGWRDGFVPELYEYYGSWLGKPRSEIFDAITEKRYQGLSDTLRGMAPGKRLLDVGCGMGHWVDFTMRAGWKVQGIDLSKAAVRLCHDLGLPVTETDFMSGDLPPGGFDVITMFELIEHVPSPPAFLARAGELLAPGGVLFMSTPNFGCLDRRLLGGQWTVIHEEHLSYFTPKSLTKVLLATGAFRDVQIRTRNVSPGALRHVLTRTLHRGGRNDASAAPVEVTPLYAESGARRRIENSRLLSSVKSGVNTFLNAFDLGTDMSILCRRV